ncbi:MAG: NADH-quinone oxidoreductase subunit N [Gammaproteobacteria bacterium]|nr:NADH-quinone oxidoreductase subunit N [Gammaproteobacteria bacterium]
MTMTVADLFPLLPLLLVTGTAVLVMTFIGIQRHYTLTVSITVAGLLVAAATAAWMLLMGSKQGGWQVTPLLIIDQYSLFFTIVTCASAIFIALLSYSYLRQLPDQREEYFLLLGVASIGAVVMVSSNHFVSTLLGLETLSMSLYGMIAYPVHVKDSAKFPLEASVKYLVLSAAASGFLLFGMALVYAQTGTLGFTSLVSLTAAESAGLDAGFSTLALLMIIAGIAFKLSLAPFHLWTPDVYEGAPIPAAAYLATVGKAAMFVVLLRFIGMSDALQFGGVLLVLSILAGASILVGNLLALLQQNIKRLLAYSSIAHMGYVLIAIIAGYHLEGSISIEAVSFYLLAYIIMTLGAFGVASAVSDSGCEKDHINDYGGLFWRSPWLAAVFTAMLLSLAGIPLTVGFIGKFYLFLAGVEASMWLLLGALILGSGIGLYYYLRIVYRMVMPVDESGQAHDEPSLGGYGVLTVLTGLLLFLGVYPAPVMQLIELISVGL